MPEIEIRDNPSIRSFFRNVTELGFTGLMWGIWLYLLLPVLNIVLWIVGMRHIRFSVIEQVGYKELFDLLDKMGWTVLIVFLIMRSWGYYNYFRFGKKDRRKDAVKTDTDQMAEYYKVTVEEVEEMRGNKEIYWPYSADKD